MHLPTLLTTLALSSSAANAQLHNLFKAKGKEFFGSATDNNELKDIPYKNILVDTNEFGQITPGNAQKWAYSEPTQNVFNHAGGDEIVNLTQSTGQLLRCHTLVWHSQAPNWVTNGVWTNATLIAAMKNHIKELVTHYKGKCYHWDVVNEAFNEDGTYRTSVFSTIIGPEFIPIAFETAALYDPDTKLYYNDYNLEYNGAKATATRNLVASLKARGIKIDGVGLQGHMIVAKTPTRSSLTALVQSFADLNVDVAYTEIDVRHETLPPTAAALAQQEVDYVNLVLSCVNVARCIGFTIWDYTDKYSWIPSTFSGQGDALPWDKDLVKKSVYWAIVSALGGTRPTSTTAVVSSTTTIRTTTPVVTSTTLTTSVRSSTTTTARSSTRTTTTTIRTSPTTTRTTTATSTGGTIPRWGQCGGQNWTGGTCQSPWVCTYSNPWYSQCL